MTSFVEPSTAEADPPGMKVAPNVVLIVLSLGATAFGLLQSAVVPALPDLQRSLHASETSAAWVLTAYLISASVLTPVLGRLGDMYGKERVLLYIYAVLAVGTIGAALSNSLGTLVVARVVQGVGGGIFPLAFSVVRDEFPPHKVPGAIGLLSSVFGIGGGAGIVVGALIVEHLSWHWLFWVPLAVLVPAALLTVKFVPESPVRVPGRIHWFGLVLMAAGLSVTLVAVSEASTWGWTSTKSLTVLVAGLVLLGAWILAELRSDHPLVDMSLMRLKGVWTTNLAAFLLGGGMFASFVIIPQFVEAPEGSGYGFAASALGGGIYLLPTTLGMLVTGIFAGRLADRFGSKNATVAGALLGTVAFGLLTGAHSSPWHVYVASSLLGLGIGLAYAGMANLVVAAVPSTQTGVASGMNTVMRSVGGAVGSAIAATLISGRLLANGIPASTGYVQSFGLVAGFLAVCLLASLVIPNATTDTTLKVELST